MAITEQERLYLLGLCAHDLFGFQTISSLFTRYHSFKEIYNSEPTQWTNISENLKKKWQQQKSHIDISNIQKKLQQSNCGFLTYYDDEYPALLKEISSPPIILYYQGALNLIHTKSLGVVGTRLISQYGKQVLQTLLPPLVNAGFTITSGFQRGVDQAAHAITVENGGKTIAVIGTGLDVDYPANSAKIRRNIIESGGLMLSEYPLTTQAFKANFPRRNRIISGLSLGVLVIEAAIKSGSLITAKCAIDQNREVFAVPGMIFSSLSYGPHHLIQEGAKRVHSAQDILSEFNPTATTPALTKDLSFTSEIHSKIYAALKIRPYTADELIEDQKITIDVLSSVLTELELEGLVGNIGNGTYIAR